MARKTTAPLDFSRFFKTFKGESDRAAAVLGAAYVEARLESLCRSRLLESAPDALFAHRGPLGDFAGKIDLAFAAGWISTESRNDLHIIRGVRNDFAHDVDHTLSFETESVRARTAHLEAPRLLHEVITSLISGQPDEARAAIERMLSETFATSRKRFELSVALLDLRLVAAAAQGARPLEKRDEWKVGAGEITLGPDETATIDLTNGVIRKN